MVYFSSKSGDVVKFPSRDNVMVKLSNNGDKKPDPPATAGEEGGKGSVVVMEPTM